ncbi:MAG: hypothetical protein V1900_02895 [Candidatus Aenigmatarchaeota archaeon]
MKLKEFLKQSGLKVVLTLILLIASSVPDISVQCPGCVREAHGFPLDLYGLPGCEPTPTSNCPGYMIHYSGLLVDVIFWYLIACLIIFAYKKIKKK